ncbi:MAG TPA: Ig-like domain-containing protein, partial [Symbiobacteriaceae bacterium]|nr:Ig-like domain-containing protein [Symbiobacteriaceae bacterium]
MGNLRKALARFLTTLIVVALSLIPAPQVTMAAPAPWPSDYTPYTTTSGTYIFDPSNDINPQQSDLTSGVMPSGSGTEPTAWAASDGTNVFFRWRIAVNPIDTSKGGIDNVAYVVQVAKDGVHKVTVGLDGKSTTTDYVYVVKADNTGMVPIYTPIYSGGTWSGARATPTSGGTGEYFIEIQVPISAITALAPDITATTPVQLFYGSSQAANLATINKDFMTGSSVSFAGLAAPNLGQGAISLSYASAAVSGPNPPVVYRQTTYDLTLTASNTGLNRIGSVSISDTLPAGVSILNTSTSSGSISSSGQTFSWTPNPIFGGTSTTATIRVAVTPAAAQANTTLTLSNGASGSATDLITGTPSSSTANSVTTGIVQNPPPTLTSTSTTLSTRGDEGFTLTLTGADFIPSSVVRIDGSDRVTTFVSSTTLQATITSADLSNAGSKSVTVFNPTPGGGTSSAHTLTVNNPAPAITSIDPTGKLQGASGFTLTVNGTNFIPESVVRVDGGARTTTYVNSTTLQVTIPASDLTTVGNRSITVFNPTPGGGTSNAVNLAVYVPGASQVTLSAPASVQAGAVSSAITLTSRNGGGTATAVSGDTVFHLSSNSLGTAVFYSDAAGTLPVTQVTIPAGQSTATFYYRDSRSGTPTISATRVSGDAVGSATTTITVTNQAPVITSGETVTADEGQGLPPVTATDADGDDLTFRLVSGSLPPGVSLDEETGTFTGTVGYEATGPYVVTIEVSDGKGGTDTVTITITVNNVNRNPSLGAIGNRSVNEGSELSISLSATDSDLPAQSLTFTVLSGPGSITGSTYTWTPAENQDGTHNVTVQVEDSLGATDFETFTVTVSEVNTAPV